jgi:hypothetical protein
MSPPSTNMLSKCGLGPYELENEMSSDFVGRLWTGRATTGPNAGALVTIRRIAESGTFRRDTLDDMAEAAFWAMDLRDHGLVAVKDVVGDADELGIVFRRLEGCTLRVLLDRAATSGRPVPEAVASRLVIDVAQQLMSLTAAGADERGYAFAGVMPDSVFVERTGRTRVLDAGVWAVAARRALAGNHVGARYFAPEQLDGRCDARTDVFALGLLLWEMLTVRPSRHARNFRALSEEIRTTVIPNLGRLVRSGAPVVTRALGDLVARALDPEPSRRFATPWDLAMELVEIIHPVTEAEAAVMLGLSRSSGVRPRARPDAPEPAPASHSLTGGNRRQLDTMPYPLDEGAVLADAPLIISAEPEADDSSRETLPSFDVDTR